MTEHKFGQPNNIDIIQKEEIQIPPDVSKTKGTCRKCGEGELRFHHSGLIDPYDYYIYQCSGCGEFLIDQKVSSSRWLEVQ